MSSIWHQYGKTAVISGLIAMLMGGLWVPSVQALDLDEEKVIQIYEHVAPAVVTISVASSKGPSSGAGCIIDPDGYILTSRHVVGLVNSVTVETESGEKLSARVLARVEDGLDLAILKVDSVEPFPYVPLGRSRYAKVGQRVLAIGNPYGFERTLTMGIISRIDRKRKRIQTDASINPGNSGGPLLNTDGEMIGINQSIFNPEGRRTNIGIGFAVPVDSVRQFIQRAAGKPNQQFQAAVFLNDIEQPQEADVQVHLEE